MKTFSREIHFNIHIDLQFVTLFGFYIEALVSTKTISRPSPENTFPKLQNPQGHCAERCIHWLNDECHFVFSLVYQLCLALWSQPNTRMLVTLCICLKQYFDTRYLVFYNTSPPRMFLSLDLLWEYRIQHGANGPLYVTSCYSTWIFCRGVSGFATDCPCDVWCRGLTTCLLHVGPPFGNRILNNSWAVGLT